MSEPTDRRVRAAVRVAVAGALGLIVGGVLSLTVPWQVASLLGWDTAALVFTGWVWIEIGGRDAEMTKRIATREDDSRRAADLVLIAASVASLLGVGMALLEASRSKDLARAGITTVAVVSVVASWVAVHTVFTLRYAHLFYLGDGGIDFHDDRKPDYGDFAYVAFTIGMTYQVSDSDLTGKTIRMTALRHALLSYLFGIAVVALTINVVATLIL